MPGILVRMYKWRLQRVWRITAAEEAAIYELHELSKARKTVKFAKKLSYVCLIRLGLAGRTSKGTEAEIRLALKLSQVKELIIKPSRKKVSDYYYMSSARPHSQETI